MDQIRIFQLEFWLIFFFVLKKSLKIKYFIIHKYMKSWYKKDGMCTYGTEFKKFSTYVADTM